MVVFIAMAGSAFGQQVDREERKERIKKHRVEKVHVMRQKAERMSRIPNLSDDQKEEIKAIMLANREKIMPLQNQLNEKRARLKTLRTSDEVNMDAINEVVDEMSDLRSEIMKQRLSSEQQIRELLTDEQRVVFDSRRGKAKHWGMRRHHMR